MCATPASPAEKPGGPRGILGDNRNLRADMVLLEHMLREGYEIKTEHRAAILADALHIVTAKNPAGKFCYSPRYRLRAQALIDRFDRTNLERVRILASIAEKQEPGYQPAPSELHKHEHLHLEGAPGPPMPESIPVVLVDDWYGTPGKLLDRDDDEAPDGQIAKAPGRGTMSRSGENGEEKASTGNSKPRKKNGGKKKKTKKKKGGRNGKP